MEIRKKFVLLVTHILLQLQTICNADIRKVRVVVSNFPASRKFENMLFFQKHLQEIREASTLDELFTLLGQYKYWNWENYHLLSAIVEVFGTQKMKDEVKTYEKELQAFRINTKLSQYAEIIERDTLSQPQMRPDFAKLVIKLGSKWSEYTLKCVESFWQEVIDEYSLTPYALVFHNAKPGCICLTFLVPACVAPLLNIESKNKQEFFKAHDVLHLTIDGCCVFDANITSMATNGHKVVCSI